MSADKHQILENYKPLVDFVAQQVAAMLNCADSQEKIRETLMRGLQNITNPEEMSINCVRAKEAITSWMNDNREEILGRHFGSTTWKKGNKEEIQEQYNNSTIPSLSRPTWINYLAGTIYRKTSFGSSDQTYDELIQVGNNELVKIFTKYDVRRGLKLSTFAAQPIRWAMINYLRKNRMIQLPRRNILIKKVYDKLMDEFIDMPTKRQIVNTLNKDYPNEKQFTVEEVDQAFVHGINTISEDEAPDIPDDADISGKTENKDFIKKMITRLKPEWQKVIIAIYFKKQKYKEIAKSLHESEANIRQWHLRALKEMAEYLKIRFTDERGKYYFLSNTYPRQLFLIGDRFNNAWEAYNHLIGLGVTQKGSNELDKINTMKRVLLSKFAVGQTELVQKLNDTEDASLIYESTNTFWGFNDKHRGRNLLGHLLEDIRLEIRLARRKRAGEKGR
jgi:RNA polymerase sigma factor (sigma-70 family)